MFDLQTIKDPKAVKPEDWDEREKIPDPEDKKPEGWDDIPATVADPDAKKPEDWDDEEDGACVLRCAACGGSGELWPGAGVCRYAGSVVCVMQAWFGLLQRCRCEQTACGAHLVTSSSMVRGTLVCMGVLVC